MNSIGEGIRDFHVVVASKVVREFCLEDVSKCWRNVTRFVRELDPQLDERLVTDGVSGGALELLGSGRSQYGQSKALRARLLSGDFRVGSSGELSIESARAYLGVLDATGRDVLAFWRLDAPRTSEVTGQETGLGVVVAISAGAGDEAILTRRMSSISSLIRGLDGAEVLTFDRPWSLGLLGGAPVDPLDTIPSDFLARRWKRLGRSGFGRRGG